MRHLAVARAACARWGRDPAGHRCVPILPVRVSHVGFVQGRFEPLGLQPLGLRPADVVGPAELLEHPDQAGRGVDLTAQHAVPRAGRVGVVQVVPGLAERQDRQRPEVRARSPSRVSNGRSPYHVADRVDGPGHVVQQADAHQPGPEERGQRALPGPGDQAADQRRHQQEASTSSGEQLVDPADVLVGDQVGREPVPVGQLTVEQPADVREEQALGQAQKPVAVAPRRVRVALLVGVRVVPAVVGDPLDDGALDGERAGHRQRDPQRALGLERAVREVPVEADRDPETGHHVEDHGDRTSVQDSQPPQATGTAASIATNGITTKATGPIRMPSGLLALGERLGSGRSGSAQGERRMSWHLTGRGEGRGEDRRDQQLTPTSP